MEKSAVSTLFAFCHMPFTIRAEPCQRPGSSGPVAA
jgi:hypothetical protein